jgi:hypothetical protein
MNKRAASDDFFKQKHLYLMLFLVSAFCCACEKSRYLDLKDLQAPLIKKYTAVYRVKDLNKPNQEYSETYSSDGNGHLRIDRDDNQFTLFDCKSKRTYRVSKSKKIYCSMDKTVDSIAGFALPAIIDECGKQNEIADFKLISDIRQLNRVPEHDLKLGLRYKPCPEPKNFIGEELIDAYRCRHYFENVSTQVKSELWYCPELNCCVKYKVSMFGEKRESTLVNYKGQADPELFNLSKYQQVQGSEFKRKAEKI